MALLKVAVGSLSSEPSDASYYSDLRFRIGHGTTPPKWGGANLKAAMVVEDRG
jgi:hypothetical protein